jgi:hypothetical protein
MDKSDNENIAHTVKLYLFEAKDHPINDECRKYKIQLLAYSSLAYFLLLFLNGREITSFLGIKIDPGVSSLTLAGALCFIIAYYMFVYWLTLQESINSWSIKSGKSSSSIKKQNISDIFDFIPSSSLAENNSKAIAARKESNDVFYKIDHLIPEDWREESIKAELATFEKFTKSNSFKNTVPSSYENLSDTYEHYFNSLTKIAVTFQEMHERLKLGGKISQSDLDDIEYKLQRLKEFYGDNQPELVAVLPMTRQVHQKMKSLADYYSRITTTFQQVENERCQIINNILKSNDYLSEQIYTKLDSLSLKRNFFNETLPYKLIPFGYSSLVILLTVYFFVCPAAK